MTWLGRDELGRLRDFTADDVEVIAATTGSGAPTDPPTGDSPLYLDGADLYVWDGSAWHGPYLISDEGA